MTSHQAQEGIKKGQKGQCTCINKDQSTIINITKNHVTMTF